MSLKGCYHPFTVFCNFDRHYVRYQLKKTSAKSFLCILNKRLSLSPFYFLYLLWLMNTINFVRLRDYVIFISNCIKINILKEL